jgi:hypothetical protein
MRRLLAAAALLVILAGCAETVRCPEGQVFGDDGRCKAIGARDGGARDGGANDGGG